VSKKTGSSLSKAPCFLFTSINFPLVLLSIALLAKICLPASAQERPAATMIVTNAKIWTVDPKRPKAEAIAVIGQRIVAVGTAAEIDGWRGPETKMIDGRGRLVLPGFNDAHVHFLDGGLDLDRVDLKDANTPQEFVRRIADRAKRRPGRWILGGNWDETQWDPPTLPSKDLIDPVTGDTPVLLWRYDGHMALANSAALKLADINKDTEDPPGGVIMRDHDGNPTGILKDSAMNLMDKAVPPLTHDERLRAIKRALKYAATLGVTSVQEMGNPGEDLGRNIEIYEELQEKGELTARIYVAPMIEGWADQAKLGVRHGFGSSYLRVGAVKGYVDGSIGSSTAYMLQPYTDNPKSRGLLTDEMHPLSKMRDRLTGADKAGLQICLHAIGDAAISMALDMFQEVQKKNGDADHRWRIEHAQHVAAKDFARFAHLKVIASMQPYHAIDDGRWVEKRIGAERAKTSYAWRDFLDAGVHLAIGTDWDVAPLDPMLTMYAATTRATLDGKHPAGWFPEQKLTVAEAVEGYTMGSAFAEFQEMEKGSITPGKLADLILLSDDIFSMSPQAIKDVKVEETIVGGKVVFEKQ
jgi:predicted amidohydrolase YtcJ